MVKVIENWSKGVNLVKVGESLVKVLQMLVNIN